MSKGNSRPMGTGWGACKVIAFWWLIIGIGGLMGCGLGDVIDRIECGQHMQHCQGEGVK